MSGVITPPALHPIRRVIIRGAWPSDPDDEYMNIAMGCLFKFIDQHSPVEWLICDDEFINALDQTQWKQYKQAVLSLSGYDMRPEVCEHVMETWVIGWDRDEGDPGWLHLRGHAIPYTVVSRRARA